MAIQDIEPGTVINYGGMSWTVVEHQETGTICLATDIVGKKPFFEEDGEQNWASSDLKSWMTETFLKQIVEAGATNLVDLELDLTAANGETDYGTDKCKVGIMSEQQVSTYQALAESLSQERQTEVTIIPQLSVKTWLCTPYSCNETYEGATYTHNVKVLEPSGSISGSLADADEYGVLPMIKIAKDTDV